MDISEKIKRLMGERGWNIAQLASNAGLRPSTLSSMFRRSQQPTMATFMALCKAFGMTPAQFFADGNLPLDLTPEQADMLTHWNALNDERKRLMLALIKSYML